MTTKIENKCPNCGAELKYWTQADEKMDEDFIIAEYCEECRYEKEY